ncbi:MAG: sigma-54-dependent Fis family transcriptional regulator [Chitinivibrionales bacterium]|nr:sigma-54-dependent Fis family transcriptional regulator [Chitinivibrionales bacterium]
MAKILIVDDEGKMRALIAMALDAFGHHILEAENGLAALELVQSQHPDLVITDIRMPVMSGLELLQKIKQSEPQTEVIVMTAFADATTGIEAMRGGALEYVTKPFEMEELLLLVKQACEKHRLLSENESLRDAVGKHYSLDTLSSKSKMMQEVLRQAKIVAGYDTTVLVRGKSGTGKELLARGIHHESGRTIFLAVNCGAIPETLLESELFGYEKGAFTGATAQKIGLFERAENGTIFLDEIGDISPSLQVKLLRVLQEKEFTRVGGTTAVAARCRVIAATNRNLEQAVSEGDFREDLYYRLNVFPLFIPSLSQRREDLLDMVELFMKKFNHTAGIDPTVIQILMEYGWPGNIRELENCMERSVIIAHGRPISLDHIPTHIRDNKTFANPALCTIPDSGISLDEVEKRLIIQALEKTNGNKSEAARLLGISRRQIYSKMQTHNITGYSATD